MKEFIIHKHYTYAEIYYVEAENEKDAIDKLEEGMLDGSFGDPDDIFSEFDFYDVMEIKE